MSDEEKLPVATDKVSLALSLGSKLVPNAVKAFDRLLGSVIGIPTAYIDRFRLKVEDRTNAIRLIEAEILKNAIKGAQNEPEFAERALQVLVNKEFRKQINREAIAEFAVKHLSDDKSREDEIDKVQSEVEAEISDDWLNVFEKFAEVASSERLQMLWGKVLAGEIRKPGKYSLRTLRFLSEVSVHEAEIFEVFAQHAFAYGMPRVSPFVKRENLDKQLYEVLPIDKLNELDAIGLIKVPDLTGMYYEYNFSDTGYISIIEDDIGILIWAEPGEKWSNFYYPLTPLGKELIGLVSSRDRMQAAEYFANFCRQGFMKKCAIGSTVQGPDGQKFIQTVKILWE